MKIKKKSHKFLKEPHNFTPKKKYIDKTLTIIRKEIMF